MMAEFKVNLESILQHGNGLLTADVLRMFGFPRVDLGQGYLASEAKAWCEENNIGSFVNNSDAFWFNDHEDAVLFKLRWG